MTREIVAKNIFNGIGRVVLSCVPTAAYLGTLALSLVQLGAKRTKKLTLIKPTMNLEKITTSLLLTLATVLSVQPVKAENVCKVTDPTGTPLNVRDQPSGRVINSLRSGREVYIEDIAYDDRGRPWAKISGYYNGEYRVWGWVFREFISCYDR